MHRWTLFGLLPCLLMSNQLLAEVAKLYTWQDLRGIRHYSQLPPTEPVDFLPLPPPPQKLNTQRPTPYRSVSVGPAIPVSDSHPSCDELMRDELHYRRHMIEERYQYNRLQCELQDINQPTKVGLTNCYAKQYRWRQKEYGQLQYLDACR